MREPLPRLDADSELRDELLRFCRLRRGQVWEDPIAGHRVGVLDAADPEDVARIIRSESVDLVVNDPPYNLKLGPASAATGTTPLGEYLEFSRRWVDCVTRVLAPDAHVYVWMGADVKNGFQPLPDFMLMMREVGDLVPRNLITLRNQRGYGTQKNWMWVRQELLHYVRGDPEFKVVYTDIPKILGGYYKNVGGLKTDNLERGKSATIRPGNVWVDVQQVFYRLPENVPGAYAQKPLAAIERIVGTSSPDGGTVLDCFAHSGTTLIAGDRAGRRVLTFDIDPVFAELTIRRLEHFRQTTAVGWQCAHPFPELNADAVREEWA